MKTFEPVAVFVALLSVLWAGGCGERTNASSSKASPDSSSTPTPTALWAYRQVDMLLADEPDTLQLLSDQLLAIATLEGGDPDASLPMDLRPDELESIWQRVREKYNDTDWVRGFQVSNGRALFVHTLMSLYVRDKAPTLFEGIPGPFDSDAQRWPAWIEEHAAQLGTK